jgi:hypothetical protein
MRKLRPRGSTIVVALLITTVLVTIAVSLLAGRVAQRSVANSRFLLAQAEGIAWAGLEDARVKLMNSRGFPPTSSFGSTSFSYSDVLLDGTSAPVGTYLVEVDLRYQNRAIIRSTARLAGQEQPVLMLRGELDTELERKSYQMDGTEGTEVRPFLWMRVEVFDVQAAP